MTTAERHARLHFKLKQEAAMTTREELNADFDRLSESVLRVKRERDALLTAAKAALEWSFSITQWEDGTPYINGRYDSTVDRIQTQLQTTIADCEKP